MDHVDSKRSNSELIDLLEKEAAADLNDIDFPAEKESEIKLADVQVWYFETEKLIRVLANTLPSSMAQPINQLRYAGHHILKPQIQDQSEQIHSNTIEAYKHCKRAYFDALDLYVYHLSETYRDKLVLLPAEESSNLANLIALHLEKIQNARFDSPSRIDYYNSVRVELVNGLQLINQVNEAIEKAGFTQAMLVDRAMLLDENNKLNTQIEDQLKKGEKKFNIWMLVITAVIVIATFIGLIFQGAGTQLFWKNQHYLYIEAKQPLVQQPNINFSPTCCTEVSNESIHPISDE